MEDTGTGEHCQAQVQVQSNGEQRVEGGGVRNTLVTSLAANIFDTLKSNDDIATILNSVLDPARKDKVNIKHCFVGSVRSSRSGNLFVCQSVCHSLHCLEHPIFNFLAQIFQLVSHPSYLSSCSLSALLASFMTHHILGGPDEAPHVDHQHHPAGLTPQQQGGLSLPTLRSSHSRLHGGQHEVSKERNRAHFELAQNTKWRC